VNTDSAANSTKLYEYVAYPLLQVVTWPLENILAPGVKLALYPTKAPLRYFLNENVIDRTIGLISIGHDNKIMLYPTLNLAPGTGSYTGLTFRHGALFGRRTERTVAKGNIYVNGDWKFREYVVADSVLGSRFSTKASISLVRVKNTSINQPGTDDFWLFADTSNIYSLGVSHPLFEHFELNTAFDFRQNHYGLAPPQEDSLSSGFFKNDQGRFDPQIRGLQSDWVDRMIYATLSRDTRNNENIPLTGSEFSGTYIYHFTDRQHDFHGWAMAWTGYFKLGKEKYEISSEEERKGGKMSVHKVLEKMDYENLRHELLNRKVLAVHLTASQSYEVPGNRMPVYGLPALGNDTPMRGYAGSRFRDYTVAAVSAEYRFPIMRLVDGVMFDEYGVYGRSWDKIDYLGILKNSWGFGIRVRRPDIYLFRAQLGFHGLHGIQLNMSVDEPF
jgi:hypothetical protein